MFFSDKHQCKGNKARFRKTPLYVLLNVLVYVFTSTSKKKQNKTKQNKTKQKTMPEKKCKIIPPIN